MAAEQSILVPITKVNGTSVTKNVGINIDNISFAFVAGGVTKLWVETPYKADSDIYDTAQTPTQLLALADASGYVQNGLVLYTVTSIKRGAVTVPAGGSVVFLMNRKKIKSITLPGSGSQFDYSVELLKSPWIFTISEVIPSSSGSGAITVNTILGPSAAAGVIEQHGITTGITAFAGGGQASAVILVSEYSEVATVATAADSVKLPALTSTLPLTGRRFVIRNSSANALAVFPPVGGNLGAGVNTVVSLAAGARIEYVSTSALVYVSFLG
jgi:hypothetical protein